ncbi:MAG TPA: hypothetical protein H9820_03850 [Candidatus Companilactobacillus pullicola]|uniref:Uncharacterized protein n=1 Tax=Candidatus Companilactobacillus pullicola TaxID=2838523 RepID=A0A9D1ZQ41_9LACO|nr:hypothetical protein [Candidatus Companilactobacillus pullicola]
MNVKSWKNSKKGCNYSMHSASIIVFAVILVIDDGPKWLNAIANLIRALRK